MALESCPRESEVESSVNPFVTEFKTGHEFREADQTKRIDEQWRAPRRRLSAGRCPVRPIARHGNCALIGVTKAQRVLAGKPPDLQNLKCLAV